MIELHYIEAILFLAMWIISIVIAYWQGVDRVVEDYRDAVNKWGDTVKHYKELHSMYKELLEEYREIQSKIHMN